jgi:hypothetical protein
MVTGVQPIEEGVLMSNVIAVLDPTARAETIGLPGMSGSGFTGQRVGLLSNKWPSWDTLTEVLAANLEERYGISSSQVWEIPISTGAEETLLDEVAASSDLVIVGLAN